MTPEAQALVIAGIAEGKFLKDLCGKRGVPSRETVRKFSIEHPEFLAQCTRAREFSAELNECDVAEVIESVRDRRIEPDAARVMINGLTWLAKVRAPRVYGDRMELDANVKGGLALTIHTKPKEPDA